MGWVAPKPPVSVQLEVEDATRKLRLGDFLGNPDPALRSCKERSPLIFN